MSTLMPEDFEPRPDRDCWDLAAANPNRWVAVTGYKDGRSCRAASYYYTTKRKAEGKLGAYRVSANRGDVYVIWQPEEYL